MGCSILLMKIEIVVFLVVKVEINIVLVVLKVEGMKGFVGVYVVEMCVGFFVEVVDE